MKLFTVVPLLHLANYSEHWAEKYWFCGFRMKHHNRLLIDTVHLKSKTTIILLCPPNQIYITGTAHFFFLKTIKSVLLTGTYCFPLLSASDVWKDSVPWPREHSNPSTSWIPALVLVTCTKLLPVSGAFLSSPQLALSFRPSFSCCRQNALCVALRYYPPPPLHLR